MLLVSIPLLIRNITNKRGVAHHWLPVTFTGLEKSDQLHFSLAGAKYYEEDLLKGKED